MSAQIFNMSQISLIFLLLFFIVPIWQGEVECTQLHATWVDNSSNEAGFKIERKIDAGGKFAQIATVGENVVSYTDSGLAPRATYCYRVQAFNLAGDSAYSNEACATTSTLMALFECPEVGPVSGIAIIRGWAFAIQAGVQIASVELFIDGVSSGDIPCCSERADVQTAFPQFPAANTLNSGWGVTFNWGNLSAGMHTVRVGIYSTIGEVLSTETRTVTVVKPGNFSFVDRFTLSGATAWVTEDELVVGGIVVRDKATQQQKRITAHFRWFTASQSLQTIAAETTATLSFFRSFLTVVLSTLSARLKNLSVASAQAAPGLVQVFEGPEEGQIVSGVAIIRGWAFTEGAGTSLTEVRLILDGQPDSTIPCCSRRLDVAGAYPGNSNALDSGWGITFNYGNLPAGFHSIGVRLGESTGAALAQNHEVAVVKIGGFAFADQFDLSAAAAWVEGEEIVIAGVQIRDKASQQIRMITVRLRWFVNSQALGIVSSIG
jgi:hypothetical protein